MRGYFGVGAEGVSKAMNLGAVMRTAHAFGASFVFTLGARHGAREIALSDTSKTERQVPLHVWEGVSDMQLPNGCALVGVELDPVASALPRFRHPLRAAYLLGPEKGDLSDEAKRRCAHLVKIPTLFCVNLSVAAAIVLYDRLVFFAGAGERTAPFNPLRDPPQTERPPEGGPSTSSR